MKGYGRDLWEGTMSRPSIFSRAEPTVSMSAVHKNSVLRHLLQAPVYLYRWRLGPLFGKRFLLLTHTGRRTGIRHQTVLEVMEYREVGPEAVVMSGFGWNSDWLRNIEATPNDEVVIGFRHFLASHRFLSEEEGVNVVRNYELRNRFMTPLVRRVLSQLLGWRYRGCEGDRRRLVAQLPLIAFRPRS
jgi:deazaflavin-dependent oxidoreductase (nitroreductase family)